MAMGSRMVRAPDSGLEDLALKYPTSVIDAVTLNILNPFPVKAISGFPSGEFQQELSTELICSPAGNNSLVQTTRGLLATDHVILNHGQVTWTTPELAPPLLTTTPHQREDVSALDRFNVHRCPTRRVFSGTGLELVTRQATVRYLYHSATAATPPCRGMNVKSVEAHIPPCGMVWYFG
ncbi:uncharacterized protein TNCV_2489481 [Trichonephila clavipes]|nr:uncharacterized protein TNCV_2489481 [Trichonephila clavipes]